jgi:class III lanthionine synthetase
MRIAAVDTRYEPYILADRIFYDSPQRWRVPGGNFPVGTLEPPPGWESVHQGPWVSWLPPHTILPPQGWKIHVSACLRNAEEILGIVRDYCVQQRIAFKFLRNKGLILAFNTKYAARESSGKFMTLYPVDEAGLRRTLEELNEALGGREGGSSLVRVGG